MADYQIVIAGFGGQGVSFPANCSPTRASWTASQVSWLPSYGPEMRGGTANCSVIRQRHARRLPHRQPPERAHGHE
jgi:2-oxoglutarate ferredoxin oxidoreductase subunit gamma